MGDYNRHSGDEDVEEDEETSGPMLGFLFGNVDISGDLDEEYLDQDVKEHLSALAGQLRESLVDIKESGSVSDISEGHEDYNRKADNAVDYEDIQEEYEGPEVQLQPRDEDEISQDQSFYAQAALERPSVPLGEDEDYDEDDDYDKVEGRIKEDIEVGQKLVIEVCPIESAVVQELEEVSPWTNKDLSTEIVHDDAIFEEAIDYAALEDSVEASPKHELLDLQDFAKAPSRHELPILYEEDGKEVLKFSELFGQDELPWVCRRDRKYYKRLDFREKSLPIRHESLEEDELALLKSCSTRRGSINETSYAFLESEGADSEEVPTDLSEDLMSLNLQTEVRSAQPMKEDLENLHESIQSVWIPSPNLQLIHQEDWETAIVWDEAYHQKVREDHAEIAIDTSGSIEEEIQDRSEDDASSMRERDECWESCLGSPNEAVKKRNMAWQASRPVVVEPLCKKMTEVQVSSLSRHPQLLRLELLQSKSACAVSEEAKQGIIEKTTSHFKKINLQSCEIQSGSWLDHIIWDEQKASAEKLQRSKVIFNLQDDQMVFQILEGKDIHHLKAHAAAMIITPQLRNHFAENGDMHLGLPSLARFNISNDKYYMNKKNQQQQKSNFKKRPGHGIKVLHSTPAIKLQTMKPKLANKDLANFHRPKAVWYPHHNEVAAKEQGSLSVSGPMKVILKAMGGKGSKLTVDASEPLESLKVKASKKFGDLRVTEKTKIFYGGRELRDSTSLADQEVKPNSILHLVRTKVHLWPKAQRLPGESKPTRPPGAFKKKSDLSVKDGHVFIAEYCEERPLLLSNVGMGARLCTYYRKISPTDSTAASLRNERGSAIGIPVPLEPMEDSPFLGDIRPGDTQTCLETNMFRAPAFHHKVSHTDFLLVRSSKGKLSLRRIDHNYVVGQQEPHMEVFTPSSKIVQTYLHNRLLAYLYREFRSNEKPGSATKLRADEILAQFPSISEGFLRKRLRHCADIQRTSGGELWIVMKRNFRIPSEEELRRMVIPEHVCAYESMQAGVYHLKRIGVSKLTHISGVSAAINQLPVEALVLATASHLERELQITPWNLSYNFVAATMHGRGTLERLEITGAGDPSGRGLGFSYVRAVTKPPGSSALSEKKAAAARGGGAVTGTNADLRRLSMDAAREVLLKFNVPESQIEKLTRWHRIAMVRKLSSEQAASRVKPGEQDPGLNKFARGHRMSFLQLQQQTREKCQEIWDRQVRSLSIMDGEYSESEGEANEDLDSFAGDLENLLEAEEGDTEEVVSAKNKKESIRGSGAWRRALEAQREDIEDEEAEAAELRRMLMEDDEADDVKKKKKASITEKESAALNEGKSHLQDKSKSNLSKKKKIIKRIIRTKQQDGTYTSREVLITDPKEVALYLARKSASQNGDQVKEKKVLLSSKKTKQTTIMKDGKKPKKLTKGDGGREGLQLICGACGRMGHMRTNKKVCPLYREESRANTVKIENIDTGESTQPSRSGIKITLKSANGPVQEKEHVLLENKVVNSAEKKEQPPVSASKPGMTKIIMKKVTKEKEQMSSPASSTISQRITVKNLLGAVEEKVEPVAPLVTPPSIKSAATQRLPSFKIKLSNSAVVQRLDTSEKRNLKIKIPVPSTSDAAAPSTSKTINDALVEPLNDVGGSTCDTLRITQGGSSTVKKIKFHKRARSDFEATENVGDKMILDQYRHRESPTGGRELAPTRFSWYNLQHGLPIETEADTQSDNQVVTTVGNYSRRPTGEMLFHTELEADGLERQKKKELKVRRKTAIIEEKKKRVTEDPRDQQREVEQKVGSVRLLKWQEDRMVRERAKHERQSLAAEKEQRREKKSVQQPEIVMLQQRRETERTRQKERKELQWHGIGSERFQSQVGWVQEQEETEWELQETPKHIDREKSKVRKDVVISHGKRASTRDRRPLYQERSSMKRRASIDDDVFDDSPEYNHHQPKRRKGGEVSLANILEGVVNTLRKSDVAFLFLKPVTKKDAPDYLDVIKNPMDLSSIREKVRKMTYKSRHEFRDDVWQIAENAHIYNDNRNPGIPPLADELLAMCDELLHDKASELAKAEATIERPDGNHTYAPPRIRR